MAVNKCRNFLRIFQRRSLLSSSSGINCILVNNLSKASSSVDCKGSIRNIGTANVGENPESADTTTATSAGSGYSNNKEEEEHEIYEESIRTKILQAALPFVHNYGWSKDAISAGAESLGYPGIVHGMFPRGGAELVQHFYCTSNQQLVEKLKTELESEDDANIIVQQEGQGPSGLKTPLKKRKEPKVVIAYAVETRLRMIEPYLSNWPQALAIMTLPPNVPTSLANLLTLVDDIWYYAGDRSVDFNWYTRRVALAGIYKMTELYMIQDGSPDHENTWTFLNRRLDEATQLHSLFVQSESAAQFAKDIASSTFITARNMLGLNWNR
ncbi:ubiquinone biosynthesis protein COQ9, mitochondrial-like isoform X2 [Lycorma delicatula]|uniref:ubiquinone biosynthesis protein COQ9, mitochondrial-like isoform X2 n=1 Tax=Lycorma delicatula TaxID=130591 RepID=UPI003F514030